jgi:ABC-2 type transport system permease protein
MMRNVWIVARRELGALFVQPIAYVFAIFMTLVTGLLFSAQISFPLFQGGPPPGIAQIISTFSFLSIFAAPAITMRLLAEEQQTGTIELLMTLPVTDLQVVLGKFLAAFLFYVTITALTLIYPIILLRFGNPDIGPMVSAYIGLLLWGAALLGIGILASALSENQINAFIIAFGIILLLYLTLIPAELFTVGPTTATILSELSLQNHLNNFLDGLITAKDVLYYLLVTAISLFAAARVLESRRWR